MNDKLVRRAANMYGRWMSNSRDDLLKQLWLNTDRYFFTVESKSAYVKKWINKSFTRKQIPAKIIKRTIMDSVQEIRMNCERSLLVLESIMKPKDTVILSQRELIEEIQIINNQWPEVKFRNGMLSVRINNVSLSDNEETVDLGDFWVHLNLRDPINGLGVKPTEEPDSSVGTYHPHMSGDSLCLGEGDDLTIDCLNQGRLEDYFRIVEAVLRTYNEGSAYTELSDWYNPDHEGESYCESCETWNSEDSVSYCESCSTNCCDNCDTGGDICTECDDWKCENCSTTCDGCKETLCNECKSECRDCVKDFCNSCLNDCSKCDDPLCDSCESSCEGCSDIICEECEVECSSCKGKCCPDCVKNICQDCNKTTCDECINACSKCGVSTCIDCDREHNCVLAGVNNV